MSSKFDATKKSTYKTITEIFVFYCVSSLFLFCSNLVFISGGSGGITLVCGGCVSIGFSSFNSFCT